MVTTNAEKKIQLNTVLLIICMCLLSSIITYFAISTKINPSQNQSQNIFIEHNNDKININKASLEELKTLPSIGDKKAQSIINNRPFDSVYDLNKIDGISKESVYKIKELITVD